MLKTYFIYFKLGLVKVIRKSLNMTWMPRIFYEILKYLRNLTIFFVVYFIKMHAVNNISDIMKYSAI